jgi:hypothetical protein
VIQILINRRQFLKALGGAAVLGVTASQEGYASSVDAYPELTDEELKQAGYQKYHSENYGYNLLIPSEWHTSSFNGKTKVDLFTSDFYTPQERTEIFVVGLPYTYQSAAELLALQAFEDRPQVIEDAVANIETNYGYKGYNVSDLRLPQPLHPDRFTARTIIICEENVDSPPYGTAFQFELRSPKNETIQQKDRDNYDRSIATFKL